MSDGGHPCRFGGARQSSLLLGAKEEIRTPSILTAAPAGGRTGVEGSAIADDAGEPTPGLGRGKVSVARFERGKQRDLNEIVCLLSPSREAAGLGVQIGEGARGGHGER